MLMKMTSAIAGIVFLLGVSDGFTAAGEPSRQTPPAGQPSTQKPEPGVTKQVSDWWITMKIHSQFVPEDALEDSNIDVETAMGVVTLSGTVAAEAGRARAVGIAKGTDGVKSVNDKLRIAAAAEKASREVTGAAKTGGRRVTDGWIKSKIYAQFLTEDALEDSDIDVDVRTGVVTLNGTVTTDAGRARAVAVAKATEGVKTVKDALKVAKR